MLSPIRDRVLLTGAAITLVGIVLIFSCGGPDPYCGDGKPDDGEQCDDGNDINDDYCSNNCIVNALNNFYVQWEFNKGAAPQFTGDSCTDMGVRNVEVRFYGNGIDQTELKGCSERQVVFQGLPHELPVGMYSIEVRPLDASGNLLISAPIEGSYMFNDGTQVEVIIPPEAWINEYTGTFYFRLLWAGEDCDAADPPVTKVRMTLEQDGTPVGASTQAGDDLDGSSEGPCRPVADGPQSAIDLPFGAATFTVSARGTGGPEAKFEETFDTFVGAGDFNPEYQFDVNSTAPDAGVADAGPDGGSD